MQVCQTETLDPIGECARSHREPFRREGHGSVNLPAELGPGTDHLDAYLDGSTVTWNCYGRQIDRRNIYPFKTRNRLQVSRQGLSLLASTDEYVYVLILNCPERLVLLYICTGFNKGLS